MNKAFVNDDDGGSHDRCPKCDSQGVLVGTETLDAFLPAAIRSSMSDSAYYCPTPHCEVVYFDEFERTILHEQIEKPIYPKDPEAPICGCFGLTRDDIEADLREGAPRRVKEIIAKSEGPEAHCASASASGECCVPEVKRYYLRRKEAGEGRESGKDG